MNIEFVGYRNIVSYNPTVSTAIRHGGMYQHTIVENKTINKIYDVTLVKISDEEDPQLVPGRDRIKIFGKWMDIDGIGYDVEERTKIYKINYTEPSLDSEDLASKAELEIFKAQARCLSNKL